MTTIDIFFSHNGADKAWTEKLAYDIENNTNGKPITVFFDKWDIKPGAAIPQELERGLTNSRFIGLVMTQDAFNSDWVTLEHSTAMMKDPASKNSTIIPILRRHCEMPSIFKRLNYIDFTDDKKYEESLETLLNVLRDKPIVRGKEKSFETVYLQEDQRLLEKYLDVFQRPAFRTPCIWELFLRELIEAIDDTQAALNTGKLFSRSKNLLGEFPNSNQFKTQEFKEVFKKIPLIMTQLKGEVIFFSDAFYNDNPQYRHHENFYAMLMDLGRHGNRQVIKSTVERMDSIDKKRNEIIILLNQLLVDKDKHLEQIELSSIILKRQSIGGANLIAKHLDD
jgi:hypothetical protein